MSDPILVAEHAPGPGMCVEVHFFGETDEMDQPRYKDAAERICTAVQDVVSKIAEEIGNKYERDEYPPQQARVQLRDLGGNGQYRTSGSEALLALKILLE